MTASCPFCALPEQRVLFRNGAAIAVRDAYQVTPGHMLVIPMRHVTSFFDATSSERQALPKLLDRAKRQLQSEFGPSGYNIGINDGMAGLTLRHAMTERKEHGTPSHLDC